MIELDSVEDKDKINFLILILKEYQGNGTFNVEEFNDDFYVEIDFPISKTNKYFHEIVNEFKLDLKAYHYLFYFDDCKIELTIDHWQKHNSDMNYEIYVKDFRKFINDFDIKYELYENFILNLISESKDKIEKLEENIKSINNKKDKILNYMNIPLEFL